MNLFEYADELEVAKLTTENSHGSVFRPSCRYFDDLGASERAMVERALGALSRTPAGYPQACVVRPNSTIGLRNVILARLGDGPGAWTISSAPEMAARAEWITLEVGTAGDGCDSVAIFSATGISGKFDHEKRIILFEPMSNGGELLP